MRMVPTLLVFAMLGVVAEGSWIIHEVRKQRLLPVIEGVEIHRGQCFTLNNHDVLEPIPCCP